ncbi:MAG: tRNA (adenosine(37)-N6)-threonylcarbamoyltransferase complex dimerization subunit type 1 TsaB [Alphaproteobacteria bacterium]|nr:tRNA (adenosine(37)-N6)-threonylcarbamoyltransferase complex dimerization subunit type 1 TsaB [Alphaproteobacteria bacterium]
MKNDVILALDTTENSISVALIETDKVLAHQYQEMERGQGEALIPMIQEVLKKAKRDFKKVTKVAVAVGPGSFTGVRIGLATARGIGLALNIPVAGITSFEAAALETKGKVLVVLDTKRGDFFTQTFQDGNPVEEAVIRNEEQIRKLNPPTLTGSGASYLKETKFNIIAPKYESAIAVGLCSLKNERAPEPLYLRDADVSI